MPTTTGSEMAGTDPDDMVGTAHPTGPERGPRGGRTASPGVAPRKVAVTSFPALLQPVPSRAEIAAVDPHAAAWASPSIPSSSSPGSSNAVSNASPPSSCRANSACTAEFSIFSARPRGDPLRIEFFGDEVESIRRFDAATQRKIEDLVRSPRDGAGTIAGRGPGRRGGRQAGSDSSSSTLGDAHLADWLPAGSWIVLVELAEMLDEARHYLGRLDNPRGFFGVEATFKRCIEFPTVTVAAISGDSAETVCHLRTESVERFDVPATEVIGELAKVVGRDEQVLIACHNAGERERLTELLADTDLPKTGRVALCEGHVLRGFRLVADRLIVISDHELFGRRDIRRGGSQSPQGGGRKPRHRQLSGTFGRATWSST